MTRAVRNQIIKTALGLLAAFSTARGQTPAAPSSESLMTALRALRPDARLRVQTKTQNDVRGSLVGVQDSTVTIATSRVDRTAVGLEDVRTVSIRGTSVKQGTVIGAAVGGIGLAWFGAAMASGLCEFNCSNVGVGGFLAGGMVGLGVGGAAGFLIGAFTPSWRPYWSSKP